MDVFSLVSYGALYHTWKAFCLKSQYNKLTVLSNMMIPYQKWFLSVVDVYIVITVIKY